jgi:hypothetical protein
MNLQMSESINELAGALVRVQGALPTIQKDRKADIQTLKGGRMTYTYADLSTVWSAVRRVLSEHGLALVQTFGQVEKLTVMRTLLLHTSGQWVSGEIPIPIDGADARKTGSTITYFRRYCLAAMVGAVTSDEDDDAATVADHSHRPATVVRRPLQPAGRPQRPTAPADQPRQSSQRPDAPEVQRPVSAPVSPPATTREVADDHPTSDTRAAAPSVEELGKLIVRLKEAHGGAYPDWWGVRYQKAVDGLELATPDKLLSKSNLAVLVSKRPAVAAQLFADVAADLKEVG